MKYVDVNYIRLASVYLQGFKDVGSGTYIFRCPICGDSKKSTSKKRGYLYATNDGAFFKCYNGCDTMSLYHFLKRLSPDLAQQYMMESFGKPTEKNETLDGNIFKTNRELSLPETEKVKRPKRKMILDSMLKVQDLGLGHRVREYLEGRKVPADIELYFTPNLNDVMSKVDAYADRLFSTEYQALVFPFRGINGALNYLQARILFSNDKRRYVTLEMEESSPKFWGLDRVDFTRPVYLFEGPIDAMMVDNGVAWAGGNLRAGAKYLEGLCQSDLVLVYDADFKTNEQIFLDMFRSIRRDGRSVVIHDKDFGTFKDVNDAAVAGWSHEQIQSYLVEKTYSGLRAELKLTTIKTPWINKKYI
jgi:hypothetical protein